MGRQQLYLDFDAKPGVLSPGRGFVPVSNVEEAERVFYRRIEAAELGPLDCGLDCGRIVTADDSGYRVVARLTPPWRER